MPDAPLPYGPPMSPRNRVRVAVAALGCVLVVQGTVEIVRARAAVTTPCEVGAGCGAVTTPAAGG